MPSPDPSLAARPVNASTAPTGVYRVENGEFILLDVILPETGRFDVRRIGINLGGGGSHANTKNETGSPDHWHFFSHARG